MNSDHQSDRFAGDEEADTAVRRQLDVGELDASGREYGIYECTECGNVTLSMTTGEADLSCHGRPMTEVGDWDIEVHSPELREVLLDSFGLPKVGLDVCLCVIDEGPLSPAEVADRLGYDESTISRYLNDLVDIGLLEKAQLNREGGGFVNVYHSIDLETMRRETLVGFLAWAGEAASLIEKANETKEKHLDGDSPDKLEEIFWEEFRTDD